MFAVDDPQLKPGDTVVVLAYVSRTAGAAAAGIAAPLCVFLAGSGFVVALCAFLGGCVVGYVVGLFMGRAMFPASKGNLLVVKVGRSAIPWTLKAAILPAVVASLLGATGTLLMIGGDPLIVFFAAPAAGIVSAIVYGLLAALM